MRTARYKLARYFDPAGQAAQEWELYDLRGLQESVFVVHWIAEKDQSGAIRARLIRNSMHRQVNNTMIDLFLKSTFSRVVAKQQRPRPVRERGRGGKRLFP